MRKVIAILGLACLLFFIAGYRVLYHVRLHEIKTEMKAVIFTQDKNALIQFTFTPVEFSALEWEGASEFEYRDEMYDVVRVEKAADKTIVWCVDDKKETALINNYLKFHRHSSPKNTSASLFKFLTLPFQSTTVAGMDRSVNRHIRVYPRFSSLLYSGHGVVLLPPPKYC